MVAPFEIAKVFVNTDRVERPPRRIPEIWNDHGGVPLQGDHRVSLVGSALSDVLTRMRMYVREDAEAFILAPLPERCMTDGMERNSATAVSVGIKVVVAHESRNSSRGAVLRAEQK